MQLVAENLVKTTVASCQKPIKIRTMIDDDMFRYVVNDRSLQAVRPNLTVYIILSKLYTPYFHSSSIKSTAQKGIVATKMKSAIARFVT